MEAAVSRAHRAVDAGLTARRGCRAASRSFERSPRRERHDGPVFRRHGGSVDCSGTVFLAALFDGGACGHRLVCRDLSSGRDSVARPEYERRAGQGARDQRCFWCAWLGSRRDRRRISHRCRELARGVHRTRDRVRTHRCGTLVFLDERSHRGQGRHHGRDVEYRDRRREACFSHSARHHVHRRSHLSTPPRCRFRSSSSNGKTASLPTERSASAFSSPSCTASQA